MDYLIYGIREENIKNEIEVMCILCVQEMCLCRDKVNKFLELESKKYPRVRERPIQSLLIFKKNHNFYFMKFNKVQKSLY